jgi:hypothetical protein
VQERLTFKKRRSGRTCIYSRTLHSRPRAAGTAYEPIKSNQIKSIMLNLPAPRTDESPGIAACPGTTAPRTSCSPGNKSPGTLVGPGSL